VGLGDAEDGVEAVELAQGPWAWAGELQELCNTSESTIGCLLGLLEANCWGENNFDAEELELIDWQGRGLTVDPPATGGNGVPKMGVES
jgi:hypothetical protein